MLTYFRLYLAEIKKHKQFSKLFKKLSYYSRWKVSMGKDASSVKDEQPWISYEAIDIIKSNLKSGSAVFEYGGGGSTLFFMKHAREVITVEHNKEWFGILSDIISKRKGSGWKGNFLPAQPGNYVSQPDIANPDHYSSDDLPASKDHHYFAYATEIDKYSDAYFDLVLVDGRSRPACIKHAIPKLKKGGLLVLDNSERSYYLTFFKEILSRDFNCLLDEFGPCPYSIDFTKTSIWEKK